MKKKTILITKRKCIRCGKIERTKIRFTSPLCRDCQFFLGRKKSFMKKKENHLCVSCGKKAKEIKCPHCKKVVRWCNKCEECLYKSRKK